MKFVKNLTCCAILILSALPATAQENRMLVDDTGTEIEVPAHPERIVSLHDTSLSVALIELGIIPVGSHGRVGDNGEPYIRSGGTVTGYDFGNSDIAFLGNQPADIEAVTALEPDLILTTNWQSAGIEQLRSIAPTYVFDIDSTNDFDIYAQLAEVTGTTDRLEKLEKRYRLQIDTIRRQVDPSGIKVSIIQGHGGELHVWNSYGSLGKVLRDIGFTFPDTTNAIKGNARQIFSGEAYPQFDADFIFVTYRPVRGETITDARAALDEVLPGWCEVMHACRNNQVIYLPREIASSATYDSLFALTEIIGSHIVGRSFVPIPD